MEEEREWRGEGATGESAAEDGEVRPPPPAPKPPRRESEEERGGCSGGRLRWTRAVLRTSSRLDKYESTVTHQEEELHSELAIRSK